MINKDSNTETRIVTTKELSAILALSDRRIRQLENEGALIKIAHGKFDLAASVQAYIEYHVQKNKPDGDLDKRVEEAKWTKARREKTELELQILDTQLHRSEDVKRIMNEVINVLRTKTSSIPSELAPRIVGKTGIVSIKHILKKGMNELLSELSEYDPSKN